MQVNVVLSEKDLEEVRRVTTDQEAVGCVADPHSNCTGCRMVALARRVILDPHDARHSKKWRAKTEERMERRAEATREARAIAVAVEPEPDLEVEPEKGDLSDVEWNAPAAEETGEVLEVETVDGRRFVFPEPSRYEVLPLGPNGKEPE